MKALIVYGGWKGHEPEQIANIQAELLRKEGFDVEMSDKLETFEDAEKLNACDLIVPHWTAGDPSGEAMGALCGAVHDQGVGLAGMHGGMGDAFRSQCNYQFMVGGQWVAHPGGVVDYRVHIIDHADEVTRGIEHFGMHSEQYYMHVDPSNHVLATTTFEHNGCTMPVVWKRMFGKGRVFYSSLGHVASDLENGPEVTEILRRGMLWAAESKANIQ